MTASTPRSAQNPALGGPFSDPRRLVRQGRATRRFEPTLAVDDIARAAECGAAFAERVRDRQLQLRKAFVRRDDSSRPLPVGAALAASRSEVHLKLALTLIWVSAGKGRDPRRVRLSNRDRRVLEGRAHPTEPVVADAGLGKALLLDTDPYVSQFPLHQYANLFGLPKPKQASERVRRSLDHLAAEGLIWLDRTSGRAPLVQLRREDGSGARYTLPGERVATSSGEYRAEGRYITLPATLWSNGWIAALSTRALASWLALLVQNAIDPDGLVYISPRVRRDRFGLSDDSFYRGVAELTFFDFLEQSSRPVQQTLASPTRVRHAFRLRLSAVNAMPWDAL